MPARVWTALAGLITVLLVAVVGLDQWQARRGEVSLFGLPWRASPSPAASAPVMPRPRELPPPVPSSGLTGAPRIAVIVDDLGARRDVFDGLREIRRPLTVAVLPGLPLSEWTAREATQSGMEVLLDLPMEPYRYPEVDPGPGALLMSMTPRELQAQLGGHLASVPGAVGWPQAAVSPGTGLTGAHVAPESVLWYSLALGPTATPCVPSGDIAISVKPSGAAGVTVDSVNTPGEV